MVQRNNELKPLVAAYGKVEDREDPFMLGRVRVRWYGYDTEDKAKVPTESLPWATVSTPIDSNGHVTGLKEGDWVVGFFMDGLLRQKPVVLGRIHSIPEVPADPAIGFNDPRPDSILVGHQVPREPDKLQQYDDGSGNDIEEQKVKSRFPDVKYLLEPNSSRYARNEKIADSVVEKKKANIDIGQRDVPSGNHPPGTGTDVASPSIEWTEKETPYNAKYPYNNTYWSEADHLIEVDNTPNHERLHWYHRSGTFKEIGPKGETVEKIVDDEYRITLKNKYLHIEAAQYETVDWFSKEYVNKDGRAGFNKDLTIGPGGNYNITTEDGKLNIYLNGDWNVYVDGNAYVEIEEDLIATVHKNAHIVVDKNAYVNVKEDLHGVINGNANVQIDKDLNCRVKGNWNGSVGGNKTQHIVGDYNLVVGGSINFQATDKISSMAGSIESVGKLNITSAAGVQIAEVAPQIIETAVLIQHNAATTSATGLLLGFTTDSDGDTTPAGPFVLGIPPTTDPSEIDSNIEEAQLALEADLIANDPAALILDALMLVDDIAELAFEAENAEVAKNPDAPAHTAANSAGGAGGGGTGGSTGPAEFVDGAGGFLWKEGHNSGVATVLVPGGANNSVAIHEAVPDGKGGFTKGPKITDMKYHATYSDGRGIYRGPDSIKTFKKPVVVSVNGKDTVLQKPDTRND
jgi:hypothetical protein